MMSVATKLINLSVVMQSVVILNVMAALVSFFYFDFGKEKPKMYSGSNTVVKHSTHSNMIKGSNLANITRRTVSNSEFVKAFL
jgi:hypothetical protein